MEVGGYVVSRDFCIGLDGAEDSNVVVLYDVTSYCAVVALDDDAGGIVVGV